MGRSEVDDAGSERDDMHRPRAKRSRNLKLVLMVAAVPAALAGCDSEPSGQLLSSVEDCKIQQEVPVDQCTAGYQTALAEHQRLAPRFDSQADCSAQFDGCTPLQSDANQGQQHSYIPPMGGFLLGYVLGSTMGGGGYRVGGAAPLYRDYRSGGYLKPNGDMVGKAPGQVTGRRGNTALPARAMTVSRSGFGSSASARGGFGSGRGFGG